MKVAVVGGGAAGMMSAFVAAQNNDVYLFEKNEKLGKKIYITGKGRCNVTNMCSVEDFLKSVVSNSKFLMSSLYGFSSEDLVTLLRESGLPLKEERGNRVFPASDKSSDVIKCFEKMLASRGVNIFLNQPVTEIVLKDNAVVGLKTIDNIYNFDKIIICTGGISYPSTGSTGDGYSFAKSAGHNIVPIVPSLCGLNLCGDDFVALQGLSLKNVNLSLCENGKIVYSGFGEALFTHFGLSGPLVLSGSCYINRRNLKDISVKIDLKPALDAEMLNERILRDFSFYKNKDLRNALIDLMPKSMIPVIIKKSGVDPCKKVNEITVSERKNIVLSIKNLEFNVLSLRPIDEAIVTSGGVNVKEINPKTMESKLVKGLFFAGEVLDLDALTGGFNLQIAFSTGYAAGK